MMSVQCIPPNLMIDANLQPVKKEDMADVSEKVKNFAALCSLFMMVLIYNSVNELELYIRIYNSRQWISDTHGQFTPSYVNKFSHITQCLIFICNFGIFMIYFQFGLMSWSFSMPF
jgi:hypothetical protein